METRTVDTRERILDAGERLFMAHGYEGTSMRQITGEAGVNSGGGQLSLWLERVADAGSLPASP